MNSPPAKSHHSNDAPVLSNELIVEILSWLPVKTLMQIKCVCKSWKTLISNDPSFTKLHLQHSPRNTHLLLLPQWSRPYEQLDCSVVPFTVSHLIETPMKFLHPYYGSIDITIPYDPYYQLNNMNCNDIVGSCNGLICLHGYSRTTEYGHGYSWYKEYEKDWFRLWNPATKKLSEKLGDITERLRFTFGYDNLTDTYKVVAFSANKVKVFSFTDNVWRDIQNFPVIPFYLHRRKRYCHNYNSHGVYVSGTINWWAIRNTIEYEWNDITIDQFVIVSLDLATETFRQLLPPSGFVEVPPVEPSVTVLMDCLCFSHRLNETHFILWKMVEFGVQESWTQFVKISFQNLQIDYGISNWLGYDSQLFLLPLWASESSKTLIMASNQEGYDDHDQHAILYNWRDNKVEKITCFYNDIMWFFTNNYFETMVSTCQKTTPSTSSTSGVING